MFDTAQVLTEVCDNGSIFDLYSKKNMRFSRDLAWKMARDCAGHSTHTSSQSNTSCQSCALSLVPLASLPLSLPLSPSRLPNFTHMVRCNRSWAATHPRHGLHAQVLVFPALIVFFTITSQPLVRPGYTPHPTPLFTSPQLGAAHRTHIQTLSLPSSLPLFAGGNQPCNLL